MTVENSNDVTLPNAFEKGDVVSILVQNLDETNSMRARVDFTLVLRTLYAIVEYDTFRTEVNTLKQTTTSLVSNVGALQANVFGCGGSVKATEPGFSSTSAGETGDVRRDADYLYVCVAPNTWKRTALQSF